MSESIYFARQPILDVDGHIYAYELLYRDSLNQAFLPIQNDRNATAQVLVNALNIVALKDFLGGALAFVNIDRNLLLDEMIFSIPKEHFVLEILETVIVDNQVVQRVRELKDKGYRFALDDADCTKEYILNFQSIFEYIDVLKLDITTLDKKLLPSFLEILKNLTLKFWLKKLKRKKSLMNIKNMEQTIFKVTFLLNQILLKIKDLILNIF